LTNNDLAAGYHVAEWDGTGNAGQQLASGVYFLQLSAQGNNGKTFNELRKLMMLK
jgi:flagellar hook assembly protein FlgD